MRSALVAWGLLLIVAAVSVAEMRTWTFEKSGKTIQGEIVAFVGTNLVSLKGPDGKTFSVPIAYLTASNRVLLAAERAGLWKDVEVVSLEGAASGGRYKKCRVRIKGQEELILIDLLPPAVETILNNRNRLAAQVADLRAWYEGSTQSLTRVELVVNDPGLALGYNTNPVYRLTDAATFRAEATETNLSQLEAAYADYLTETQAATTLKMKKTSLVYEGLPVWECLDRRKRKQ